MQFTKTLLLASAMFTILLATGTDAWAQKKKKEKPRTKAELENTYWRLYEMDGKMVETPMDAREVYIKLLPKKSQLEGYAGCNIITGSYDLGRDYLTFEPATTERMCDDMTKENYVMKALTGANRHEINGLHLLLFHDTYLLAIFEAKYFDEEKK